MARVEPLDEIDTQLVRALRNNARLSNKELAAIVGMAPSTTLMRVRRLEERGTLRGYHADVELKDLGTTIESMIAIELSDHSRPAVTSFGDYLRELPETLSAYHLAGRHDYLIHAGFRDTAHLRNFVLDCLSVRPEVGRVETSLIYKHSA